MCIRDRPTFEDAIRETVEAVECSREFVIESGYATIPEGERLLIMETPSFMRPIMPFGAYSPPGKFDKFQVGLYWMSRPSSDAGQTLEIHNRGAIFSTSIHEGYPGHHLQLTCANTRKSITRLLTLGVEFGEGWAHYCEEKVAELGFANDLAVELERTNDMVWRAVRIIVDVKLSRGEINFNEAVDLLRKESGFDIPSCISEIKRYTYSPGQQLSYLVGKKLILDLHDKVKKESGSNFNLKKFHDSMLYAGSLPMKYMEKVVENSFFKKEAL